MPRLATWRTPGQDPPPLEGDEEKPDGLLLERTPTPESVRCSQRPPLVVLIAGRSAYDQAGEGEESLHEILSKVHGRGGWGDARMGRLVAVLCVVSATLEQRCICFSFGRSRWEHEAKQGSG